LPFWKWIGAGTGLTQALAKAADEGAATTAANASAAIDLSGIASS
jgi:hypothetical protein